MPLTDEERLKIYEEEKARFEAREKLKSKKGTGCLIWGVLVVLILFILIIVIPISKGRKDRETRSLDTDPLAIQEENLQVFKKKDMGQFSLWMELLMRNPTKAKLEASIDSLVRKYGDRTRLQIDIFDDLEALKRRDDEKYPAKLFYKFWLVSITKEKIYRFYLDERPDIE